jgi:PII-like signaling protein
VSADALRLSIVVGESDVWHHHALYVEIVHRAHRAGLAGASVFRGIEGFGAHSVIHTPHLFRRGDDLPVLVVIIDGADRVRAFLPELDELGIDGLVTLDEVTHVRYARS